MTIELLLWILMLGMRAALYSTADQQHLLLFIIGG